MNYCTTHYAERQQKEKDAMEANMKKRLYRVGDRALIVAHTLGNAMRIANENDLEGRCVRVPPDELITLMEGSEDELISLPAAAWSEALSPGLIPGV